MKKNVSVLMQVMSLTVALFLIAPLMTFGQSGKVNFSGTWTLNTEKSTLPENGGRGPRMGSGQMTVKQDATTLSQTRESQNGSRETKYVLDGKENTLTMGRGEMKYTAKWSADGKSLTITRIMNFNGNERTTTSVWTLKDAKTLSIETTMQGPNGDMKMTMVYDKK